ncbi:MAG: hypothetical protein IKV48_01250 [Eggerthellaceae bacterium]|nr:hypothetical protein [Eggerthellaceae bacterium]
MEAGGFRFDLAKTGGAVMTMMAVLAKKLLSGSHFASSKQQKLASSEIFSQKGRCCHDSTAPFG